MANDFDIAWKDAIHEFILDGISFVSPELHAQIDPNRQIIFLDKELHELTLSLENQNNSVPPENSEVDVLAQLPLLNGESIWVLLFHIEVQGDGSRKPINLRMFEYYQAIRMKYRKEVVALLIATAPIATENELAQYQWQGFGTAITYKYNVIKAYDLNEDELLKRGTPFALMLLAAKMAYKFRKDDDGKITFAKYYYDLLIAKNYDEKTSKILVVFMEQVTRLQKLPACTEYLAHIEEREKQIKGAPKMLLTMMEEKILDEKWNSGIAQGLEQGERKGELKGELKGKLETARRLRDRGMNLEQIQAVTDLSDEQMKMI